MSADTQQRAGEAVSALAGVASFLLEWKLLRMCCHWGEGEGLHISARLGCLSETSLLVKYCLLIAFSASSLWPVMQKPSLDSLHVISAKGHTQTGQGRARESVFVCLLACTLQPAITAFLTESLH